MNMKIALSQQLEKALPSLVNIAANVLPYTAHLRNVVENKQYLYPESSLLLPNDQAQLAEVHRVAAECARPNLKYIVDIGIGGSNLGTKAVYDALVGADGDVLSDHVPKILFADTCDADHLQRLIKFLLANVQTSAEVLLVLISKSGATTETIVNFEIIYEALTAKFADIADRVVAITDEDSPLWQHAVGCGFRHLAIPAVVGGRYSVFSAVGLFPLLMGGIDIDALLSGAQKVLAQGHADVLSQNTALLSACAQYYFFQQGFTIHNTFLFQPAWESVGKWYRQLMGESVGKERDLDGKVVSSGIIPVVSVGSTDLHSMVQLYLAGPKNTFTTFVSSASVNPAVAVPQSLLLDGLVNNIAGVSVSQVMRAILEGTERAYEKKDLPFFDVQLSTTGAQSVGEFMQWKMLEMMYLAQLMHVNAFDQPNVESYKTETRSILGSKLLQ